MNSRALRAGVMNAAGIRSPYLQAGPPTAEEAAVFIHGNPGSARDWQDLLSNVGSFGRAVALDMPGYGRADKPKEFEYTVDGYARHIDHCLNGLAIRRVHLIVHDFGGPWGLDWAATHPDAFQSVVVINSGVWPDYRWHLYARIWRTPWLGELFMRTVTRRGFEAGLRYGSRRPISAAFVDRWYQQYDRGTRHSILRLYRATDPSALGYAQARALRPLDRPALVIWGKRDPYLPFWLAERQRDAFPSARLVVLPNSGHFPFADDPRAVRDAVLPFLRQQLAG